MYARHELFKHIFYLASASGVRERGGRMATLWWGIRRLNKGPQVLHGLQKLYGRIQSSWKIDSPPKLGIFLHDEDFIYYSYDSKPSTSQQKKLLQLNNELNKAFTQAIP